MKLEYIPNSSSGISTSLVLTQEEPYQIVRGSLQGFGGVEFQHMSSQSPYQNGASYYMSRSNTRNIAFQFRIYADSIEDMHVKKMYVSKMLSPAYNEGILRFYSDDGSSYDLSVVPDGNSQLFQMIDNHNDTMCICNVTMTAFSPFWTGPEENEVKFSTFEEGFVLPFTLPFTLGKSGGATVVNSGGVPSPCKIILSDNFVNPVITNKRTGESISVTTELHEGESLVINTDPQKSSVTLIKNTGEEVSMFNYVSASSSMWQLQPGDNPITCDDSGGTLSLPVVIKWFDRFTGVF